MIKADTFQKVGLSLMDYATNGILKLGHFFFLTPDTVQKMTVMISYYQVVNEKEMMLISWWPIKRLLLVTIHCEKNEFIEV